MDTQLVGAVVVEGKQRLENDTTTSEYIRSALAWLRQSLTWWKTSQNSKRKSHKYMINQMQGCIEELENMVPSDRCSAGGCILFLDDSPTKLSIDRRLVPSDACSDALIDRSGAGAEGSPIEASHPLRFDDTAASVTEPPRFTRNDWDILWAEFQACPKSIFQTFLLLWWRRAFPGILALMHLAATSGQSRPTLHSIAYPLCW